MMPQPIWTPSQDRVEASAMTHFRRAAETRAGRSLPDSAALHAWSTSTPADFWGYYAEYAQLPFKTPARRVMSPDPMPHTRWFEGATLNYAEALLHPPNLPSEDAPAIIAVNEAGAEHRLSYHELRQLVGRAQRALRREGVDEGDRVAAITSNVPEAVVLLLACASLGAIFSSCSPDFGPEAALARFGQIEPKLLFGADCYQYGGKRYQTLPTLRRLAEQIPSHPQTVIIPFEGAPGELPDEFRAWDDWLEPDGATPDFRPLPFDHPLYILYSSGTTGLPKAMVHRAGGVLATHHKEHHLHSDIRPGDTVFYFTTCGWMMWNWLVSALAQGAAIVLYEGSPAFPDAGAPWRLAERLNMSFFGTSARFLHSCRTERLEPRAFADMPALRTIASTGSPLSPAGFEWVYDSVKDDVHLASISGGTDIVSCFMLGDPTRPVYAGQIQGPGLGVDLAAYDEAGRPVVGRPGELVCRQPLPSMPLAFWNDTGMRRYHDAYFRAYPGVWRHGDLIEITDVGGIVVYGRSDATLNPGGVRIGTAEIYRPLEALPELGEALAVGRRRNGDEEVWLFVVLQAGHELDDDLRRKIRAAIRNAASPRHVPKRMFQVSQLPRTRSGKTTEIAVAHLINGHEVPNRAVMSNPEALDEIARVVAEGA
ncbi:MAG TPA: acetoacetate--CoA ligase [Trueperaceae bacterium]